MAHCLAIHANCQIVIYSRRHVAPVRRRKRLVREGLEIQNAQRVFRTGLLSHGGQRARRQESQELTARGHILAHGPTLYLMPPMNPSVAGAAGVADVARRDLSNARESASLERCVQRALDVSPARL
jgi:hypothetical protein